MENPDERGDPPRVENNVFKVLSSLGTALVEGAPMLLVAAAIYFGMRKSSETLAGGVHDGLTKGLANIGSRKGGYQGRVGSFGHFTFGAADQGASSHG